MNSNELAHFGILGMKWGVRRARSQAISGLKESKEESAFYSKLHSSIGKGRYKENGYDSKKEAMTDLPKIRKAQKELEKSTNKWLSINKELFSLPVGDVKNAKRLVAEGQSFYNSASLRAYELLNRRSFDNDPT